MLGSKTPCMKLWSSRGGDPSFFQQRNPLWRNGHVERRARHRRQGSGAANRKSSNVVGGLLGYVDEASGSRDKGRTSATGCKGRAADGCQCAGARINQVSGNVIRALVRNIEKNTSRIGRERNRLGAGRKGRSGQRRQRAVALNGETQHAVVGLVGDV